MASNLALTIEPRQCQICQSRKGLQRCSGCKAVFYCGREHQTSDRARHKHACTTVRKALAALSQEEQKLRSEGQQGGLLAHENPFEELEGHFWAFPGTRDYMRARYAVVDATLGHFRTAEAVRASADHLEDMLRLCRSDNLGARWVLPALYLRLGRDQECYDFMKWWATTGALSDYDWGDMGLPFLDVRDADVLESPEGLWARRWIRLSHSACVALVKVRMLLDLRHMLNATQAFEGPAPRELINEIRGQELVSSVVASRRDIVLASTERTAELLMLVKGQVRMLFDAIASYSPAFWPMLVDPHARPESIPEVHSPGSDDEAAIMVMYNCGAWTETPGAFEVIQSLMKVDRECRS